ncbi:antibiotic biosynthesis monooxygenase family protein [Streptomyces sp. NPDC092296]|uniref:antibiotic biosynthesis monooxygenase family protein n=1 Tax=Streptomyces sp. NPDC092296 TaxID=3366012 RepID=UPI00380644E9
MPRPVRTPKPPYYVVTFVSRLGAETEGYAETDVRMTALSEGRPGLLGVDSVRGPDGFGITVSYWTDEESIASWRADAEHTEARRRGRETWYDEFVVHISRVERAYRFER